MTAKQRPVLELLDVNDAITKKILVLKQQHKDNDIFNDEIKILILFKESKDKSKSKREINIDDLKAGKYQTDKSKSDKTVTDSIKFFSNNLPSFKQYKETKSLNYILTNRRELLLELLEYYLKKNLKITTFKTRLTAIMRVYYLSYNDKDFTTYNQLGTVSDNISKVINLKEGDNKRDEREEKNHLDFRIILQRQDELYKEYNLYKNKKSQNAFNANQDLVLVSLYSLIPSLRRELFSLKFTKTDQEGAKDDYLYIKENGNIILQLNKVVKRHESITIDISKESKLLNDILLQSYEEYPRENVFLIKKEYPTTKPINPNGLSIRLKVIFKKYDKNVGINSIRSSYVSYQLKNPNVTYKEEKELKNKMRTGIEMIRGNYRKIETNEIILPKKDIQEPKLNAIQLERVAQKKYYEKNKQQIAEQQKEYRAKVDNPSYRVKLLRKLNTDAEYITKTSKGILEKYNITKNIDGKYV